MAKSSVKVLMAASGAVERTSTNTEPPVDAPDSVTPNTGAAVDVPAVTAAVCTLIEPRLPDALPKSARATGVAIVAPVDVNVGVDAVTFPVVPVTAKTVSPVVTLRFAAPVTEKPVPDVVSDPWVNVSVASVSPAPGRNDVADASLVGVVPPVVTAGIAHTPSYTRLKTVTRTGPVPEPTVPVPSD